MMRHGRISSRTGDAHDGSIEAVVRVGSAQRFGEDVIARLILIVGFGVLLAAAATIVIYTWVNPRAGYYEDVRRLIFIYAGTFAAVAGASLLASLAWGRHALIRRMLYVLLWLQLIEGGSAMVYRTLFHGTHLPKPIERQFTFHPALVGLPTADFHGRRVFTEGNKELTVVYTHNHEGWRGPAPSGDSRKITVAAVGGSTTYDLAVNDDDTWAVKLQRNLGDAFEVLNFGVLGQTSAEHIVMTALLLSKYKPACVVYYMGWNDVHTSHVADLEPDYSNFHLMHQFETLGLMNPGTSYLATVAIINKLVLYSGLFPGIINLPPVDRRGTVSGAVDRRVLEIWRRNLRVLAAAARAIGATPIYVPQVLNEARLSQSDQTEPWTPFIPDRALPAILRVFIAEMAAVAAQDRVPFVGDVVSEPWDPSDFADSGHFSATGTTKFAALLAPVVRRQCGGSARAASSLAAGAGH